MGTTVISTYTLEAAREGRSSFQYSFSFLPRPQREALKTVYAFCRVTDDIVDNREDVVTNMDRLRNWRIALELALNGASGYALLNQLSAIAKRFNIPVIHFYELLKGVEMDLMKNRYATFGELREYCYHVASSVGLMCLGIFGSKDQQTKEYAVNLGIALQLTNILRDVGVDASYGRIYLPLEDLRQFNVSEHDILTRTYTPAFRSLMEFEASRAEECFLKAQQALPAGEKRTMFAAKIMERIYFHTLLRIREENYDVFSKSVYLPGTIQFLIAIKYWVKQRIFGK